jgi:hypothetical protein
MAGAASTRSTSPSTTSSSPGTAGPFEVFINSKNMEHFAWTVALTRMISAVFRRGGDISFVVEELKAVFDPRGGAWMEGRYIPSILAAIGGVIERHLIAIGFMPLSISGWMSWGIHCLKFGAISGIMPKPTETATMNRLLRFLKVDAGQDADTGRGDHAEHDEARAAEHHGRQRFDQRPSSAPGPARSGSRRRRRRRSGSLMPVTPTRPTFWLNEV